MSEPTGLHALPLKPAVPLREAHELQEEILRLYGLKPWHVGLASVPWQRRVWRKVTFARCRVRRAIRREDDAGCE